MIGSILERLTELERRLANAITTGTIIESDYTIARARVKSGDIETAWLPWITQRAGLDRTWWAPTPGEQVVLLSPNGSPELGVILPSLYQSANPAPYTDDKIKGMILEDGSAITYDATAQALTINLTGSGAAFHLISAGDAEIICSGTLKLQGAAIEIAGPVTQTGGDMTSDGKSAQTHNHTITSGSSAGTTTGPN